MYTQKHNEETARQKINKYKIRRRNQKRNERGLMKKRESGKSGGRGGGGRVMRPPGQARQRAD